MHHHFGAAVRQQVGQARRLLTGAHWHRDRAQARGCKQHQHKLCTVAKQQGYAIALNNAAAGQPGSKLLHNTQQSTISQSLVTTDQGFAFGVALHGLVKHVQQTCRAIRKTSHDPVAVMGLVTRLWPDLAPWIHTVASIPCTCTSPSMNSTARRANASASAPTSAALSPTALPLAARAAIP